jgi:hypothetical protein
MIAFTPILGHLGNVDLNAFLMHSRQASTRRPGLMLGTVGQRLAERNITIPKPPPWGVNEMPFNQGGDPPMTHHIAFLGTGIMGTPLVMQC